MLEVRSNVVLVHDLLAFAFVECDHFGRDLRLVGLSARLVHDAVLPVSNDLEQLDSVALPVDSHVDIVVRCCRARHAFVCHEVCGGYHVFLCAVN